MRVQWVGKIPWGRKWQPTPVFLPGKWHGQRSLAGYSPLVTKESDTNLVTEWQQQMMTLSTCLFASSTTRVRFLGTGAPSCCSFGSCSSTTRVGFLGTGAPSCCSFGSCVYAFLPATFVTGWMNVSFQGCLCYLILVLKSHINVQLDM